jgi:ABC-type branched-subunit amino acid transport system substrate-binding protein
MNNEIKIGVIIPESGPSELLGKSFLKAVKLAQEDLKNTKNSYELIIEDSGTTPEQAESAIRKLIDVDHVQALLGGISKTGEIVKSYATAAKIPHLCVCSVKTIGDGEYNFTNIPIPKDEARRWVTEARERGIKTVAIISQDYPSVNGHVRAVREKAPGAGMSIVYDKQFEESTRDFRAMIAEANKGGQPDVYFVSGYPPALDHLREQLKELGAPKVASIVAPSISDRMELFEGDWYTDSDLAHDEFKRRFEQKYPNTRFATHMMPYAYDSFNILAQAFESGEDPVEYVRGVTSYKGEAGEITRERGSGNFRSRPAVWVINDGRPELVKR